MSALVIWEHVATLTLSISVCLLKAERVTPSVALFVLIPLSRTIGNSVGNGCCVFAFFCNLKRLLLHISKLNQVSESVGLFQPILIRNSIFPQIDFTWTLHSLHKLHTNFVTKKSAF
jgi:hypothetical protein